MDILFDILTKEELKARDSKNYAGVLEILKMLIIIQTFENGIDDIIAVNNSVNTVMLAFNPIHPELTCNCLELLTSLIWNSEHEYNKVTTPKSFPILLL